MSHSVEAMFRASRLHGDPHPANDRHPDEQAFYFCIDSREAVKLGHLAGFVTAEEFDWLAERIGVPKLAEVRRG